MEQVPAKPVGSFWPTYDYSKWERAYEYIQTHSHTPLPPKPDGQEPGLKANVWATQRGGTASSIGLTTHLDATDLLCTASSPSQERC